MKPAPLDFTPDLLRVLKLPSGFKYRRFAEGLRTPRVVVVSPEGALYISSRDEGTITLMPESGGKADPNHVVLQKSNVHGLAFATMNSSTSQFEKFSQRLSIQTVRLERSGT